MLLDTSKLNESAAKQLKNAGIADQELTLSTLEILIDSNKRNLLYHYLPEAYDALRSIFSKMNAAQNRAATHAAKAFEFEIMKILKLQREFDEQVSRRYNKLAWAINDYKLETLNLWQAAPKESTKEELRQHKLDQREKNIAYKVAQMRKEYALEDAEIQAKEEITAEWIGPLPAHMGIRLTEQIHAAEQVAIKKVSAKYLDQILKVIELYTA